MADETKAPAKRQPVLIYDIKIDQKRPVTQEDVDRLEAIAFCYGQVLQLFRRIPVPAPMDEHEAYWRKIQHYLAPKDDD